MTTIQAALDRRAFHPYRGGGRDAFWRFVQDAWPHVGGDPNANHFVKTRYMQVLCSDVFQPFILHRQGDDAWPLWTLLNVPPSHAKSMLSNVLLPAWVWGPLQQPEHAFGHLSYDEPLVTRDAHKCRTLIESEWYSERWPEAQLVKGSNAVKWYTNVSGGYRVCGTIRSGITGKHYNSIILDDPQNPLKLTISEASDAAAEAETARNVIDHVLPSRVLDQHTRFLVIMQRLSQLDAAQHLIDKYAGAE